MKAFLFLFWKKPDAKKLRAVMKADIDGMGAEAASHDHMLSVLLKLSGTVGMEKLILRCHDSAYKGQAHRAAVKMPGESQIRSPLCILVKI